MIVDFHTHIFPDKIAPSAIKKLEECTDRATAHTDGTLSGLLASMKDAGVDFSVVLPVVTAPKQFDSINLFAKEHNAGNIVYFGGIHPDCDDVGQKLELIKSYGLKGIKLHPDYQGVFINDERYIRIVRRALELGLFVTVHAGIDIGLPSPVHCPPELSAKLLDAVDDVNRGEPRIIFAHLGGCDMLPDVKKYFCGRNCLFDTGFNLECEDPEEVKEIISLHGADRVLFATDSPWRSQRESIRYLKGLGLGVEDTEKILGKNAARLLGLEYI